MGIVYLLHSTVESLASNMYPIPDASRAMSSHREGRSSGGMGHSYKVARRCGSRSGRCPANPAVSLLRIMVSVFLYTSLVNLSPCPISVKEWVWTDGEKAEERELISRQTKGSSGQDDRGNAVGIHVISCAQPSQHLSFLSPSIATPFTCLTHPTSYFPPLLVLYLSSQHGQQTRPQSVPRPHHERQLEPTIDGTAAEEWRRDARRWECFGWGEWRVWE